MKLVFFGTPDFAVPALQSLTNSPHQILSVVTNPDKKSGRGLKINYSPVKQACCKLGHEVIQPDNLIDKDFLNHLKQINPEIYVVVAFKILPEILLNIPPYGAINLHASLLPKYRGAAPINHAILNGEKETGLTTFQLKKKADTGNILQQKSIPIPSSATTGDIYCQLADLGGEILIKTLDGIENGSLLSRPQDEKLATAAPKISSNDAYIDWKDSALNIHNKIRAFSPLPGAYTYYKKKRIKLFSSTIYNLESSLKPGETHLLESSLIIGTGKGAIKIIEVQMEGKKRLLVSQFITGNQELVGECFG